MKTKYPLPYKIKGFIEWQLGHYHDEKRMLEEIETRHLPSGVPQYGGTPIKAGSTSNPTERAGIALASNPYIASLERTTKAIATVLDKCDATDIKLIDLVYWRRSHTVEGAGRLCNLSKSAAYNHINGILTLIAQELGVINLQ